MKCKDTNELLAAYLDEEVTSKEKSRIEVHLSSCEKCREELRLLTSTRDELKQALKTRAGEVEPPPQTWDAIRQQIESEPSFLQKLGNIVNRPVWRAAIPVLVVILLVGALWKSGIFTGYSSAPPAAQAPAPSIMVPTTTVPAATTPPPTIAVPPPIIVPAPTTPAPSPVIPRPAPPPVLMLEAASNKSAYALGEPIIFEVSIVNVSSATIMLSPDPPSMEIVLPSKLPGQDREVVETFSPGSGQAELQPGQRVTYTLVWNQLDSKGQQMPPGFYFPNIKARDINIDGKAGGGIGTALGVLIQYPQGAMQKSLELHQSQTVNGTVITLQRIELTATGIKIYALNTPPGYVKPSGKPDPFVLMRTHPDAEYSIDNGFVMDAGSSGGNFLDEGILYTWNIPDPAPSDARELMFRITRLGDWKGPWEFKVQLQ